MTPSTNTHTDTFAQTHRQLRLFISSTFVDMNAERDALTRIFPRIKEACEKRSVEFVPLDLRWGITEEAAKEGRVIETCLREIDDARPFFIGIIGNRYGWAPEEKDLGVFAQSLQAQYPWLKNAIQQRMSITEMEMQHAVLNRTDNENMNAAFYIRSEKMKVEQAFKERPGSKEEQKLQQLKNAVRAQKQFPAYDYNSVDELAEMVLKDVIEFLNNAFPQTNAESYDQDAEHQERILRSRSNSLIPLTYYQNTINDWMAGKGKRDLHITGNTGVGKSYLLANIVGQLRKNGQKVVYLDLSEHSDFMKAMEYATGEMLFQLGVKTRKQVENEQLAGCLFSFIGGFFKIIFTMMTMPIKAVLSGTDEAQHNLESKVNAFYENFNSGTFVAQLKKLEKHFSKKKSKNDVIYLAIDNMNDLEGDNLAFFTLFDYTDQIHILSSSTRNSKVQVYLQTEPRTQTLTMENLTVNQAATYVNRYLAQYGKALDERGELCGRLMISGITGNALLLNHVLSLMVRFGSYEQLRNYINELSMIKNEGELYEVMIKHILDQFPNKEQQDVVRDIIAAFAIVKKGLTESEIQEIFKPKPMDWALLRPYLYSIFRCRGTYWYPASERCRGVLQSWMGERIQNVVKKLANYFEDTTHGFYEQKNAVGITDGAQLTDERFKLERQVDILPELYYEHGLNNDLYLWATYIWADIRFSEEQRIRYWRQLYKAGYNLRNSGELSASPYNVRQIQRMVSIYGIQPGYGKSYLQQFINSEFQRNNWVLPTKDQLFQLYTHWNIVAGAFMDKDDLNWVAQKLTEITGKQEQAEVQQLVKYQNLMAAQEWDKIIALAKTDTLSEIVRVHVDSFVILAYQAKNEPQQAFVVAKQNAERIIRLGLAANHAILPTFSFYAQLSYSCGTNEDAKKAIELLNMHKGDVHTANIDNNSSLLFHRGMAYAQLKIANYTEAIAYAQVWLKILKTMGYATNDAEAFIAFVQKNKS